MQKDGVKIVWEFAKPYKMQFFSLLICILSTSFIEMLFPYTYSILIDEIFYHKNLDFFVVILIIYIILFLGMSLISILSVAIKAYLTTKYVFNIRQKLLDKILNLKAAYLNNTDTGDLITSINKDADSFLDIIHSNIFYLAGNVIRFAAAIGFIFLINVRIGIALLFIIPVSIYVSKHFGEKSKKVFGDNRQKYGVYISWLFEIIDGIREIKLLAGEIPVKKKFTGFWRELIENKIRINKITLLSERINAITALAGDLLIFIMSGMLIARGNITLGGFVAIIEYYRRGKFFFGVLSNYRIIMQNNIVSINRVIRILTEEEEQRKDTADRDISIKAGEIKLENVSFGYDNPKLVLSNVNLYINPGERIALVGASGSGKSTIANLLLGFYYSYKGSIYIDGQEIRDFSFDSIRKNIGLVRQEPLLFKDTIRNNLLIGAPRASDDDIWKVLETVKAFDFVNNLPGKLDTVIGENGMNLSGGQIQRLAIARVLLKNPRILIFDEATSSLDYESENAIRGSMNNICKGRTSIIIAHRLSTILESDRVIVLDDGEIVSSGYHNELLESCGTYRKLFKEQYVNESI